MLLGKVGRGVGHPLKQLDHIEQFLGLKKVQDKLKAGFTLEFNDREDGNKGLQSVYGLKLNVATMEPALRYEAIQQGNIQLLHY